MLQADPLAFLDEERMSAVAPANAFKGRSSVNDPLSFLDTAPESDPLAFLEPEGPKETGFIGSQIQQMPGNDSEQQPGKEQEKFLDRLGRAFSYQAQTSQAVTPRGAKIIAEEAPKLVEGFTAGFYQAPEREVPEEEKEGRRVIGESFRLTGEAGLISGANKFLKFMGINPKTWYGRVATSAGIGAGLSTAKQAAYEDEIDPSEVAKDAALWAGIDVGLEAINAGLNFKKMVEYIAERSGRSRADVLKFLKDRVMAKFRGKPQPSPEVLAAEAIDVAKEAALSAEQGTIEIKPMAEGKLPRPVGEVPEEGIKAPKEAEVTAPFHPREEELSILENTVLTKPEHISIGVRGGKGTATVPVTKVSEEGNGYFEHEQIPVTKEEQQLIDASNSWETAGDHKESSELANQARQMIFNRLKGQNRPVKERIHEELPKKQTQIPPSETRPKQPVVGKKQSVARSKILDLFRAAFTDPIRLGKIKQRDAEGIHKLWPKVTRLLNDNDIETAAHEIGHNLHTTLYGGDAETPKEQAENIHKALRPYLDELKPLALYEPWGMEGFAEFTRLYVTNPDVALTLAPKFYAKLETDLGAQYPEMKNALLQAREYYDTYLQGTPQSRIRAQTSYGVDNGKLANIVDGVKRYLNPDFLKTQFLDDVFPAKRLVAEAFGIPLTEVENLKDERNLYRALRVLKGAVGKGDVFVLHETFNAKSLKKTGGSLRDILKKLPNEEAYREFNDYLIARRATEKVAQNVKTGINAGDALIVEQELRPKYGQLAQELDKYNDALLNYAKDAGLLSPEQYAAIKENNVLYTPFQRVMETESGGAATGAGRLQAGKPINRMKGSARDIIAPIESIIKNTYSIILNAEKNLAGQVLANLAKTKPEIGAYVEHVPTPIKLKGKVEGEQVARTLAKRFDREGLDDLIEYDQNGKPVLRADIADAIPDVFLKFGAGQYPAGENIVTVYFDGKPKYYEVSPDLFEMWAKGMAPYTAGLITKILRMPARTLRAGAILNPRFIQKNVVRDTWGSWLFTKYGKSIKDPVGLFIDTLYSPLEMLAASAMKRTLYVEWMKAGGGMSTMQSLDRDAVTKKLQEVRHGYKPHQVVKWLRQVAEISEEANRLSEFGKALAVEQKSRLGAEIAAFAARDLSIDFAKMGLQTKAMNQIIPFFNATIQGADKLIRTMMNPEDRKNFLPRVIGFLVLPSLMLAWLNRDDDRIKEFHEEEKDFNFITFVGDKAIKIPVPFETGVLSHGLTQRMFNHFMKEDPEAFEGFIGSVLSAMLPNAIPAFANPFMETWANKNFFTGGRIIPRNQEELVSKYQYKRGTSSTARVLGRAITYMLGQETRSKAASPEIIDHFVNSWTGGLGRIMINISDSALEAAGLSEKVPGPGQTIVEKLGFDAFAARYPRASTRSIEKFYENYADATSRIKSIKYAEKMLLETPERQEGAYKRFDRIYDYGTLQHAYRAIQASQREINSIWNDPAIENELKEKMVDDLYLQQIEFAKAANEDIRKYRLTQKD